MDHEENGVKKSLTVLLPNTYTLYKANVSWDTYQEHNTINVHDV